jgi:hypothetical protein
MSKLSPERRRELGNVKGGRAKVPKGLATMSRKRRLEIIRLGLEARRKKAMERAQKRGEMDASWTQRSA